MKKEYVAPELRYESYVLSESIAAGCIDPGIARAIVAEDMDNVFAGSVPSELKSGPCAIEFDTWKTNTAFESYCYWNGTLKLFLS